MPTPSLKPVELTTSIASRAEALSASRPELAGRWTDEQSPRSPARRSSCRHLGRQAADPA